MCPITQPTFEIYRAWVNQPSTLQPRHDLPGRYCVCIDTGADTVRLYFTEGSLHSTIAPRECIARVKLSSAD
jgi:hypothetical protein